MNSTHDLHCFQTAPRFVRLDLPNVVSLEQDGSIRTLASRVKAPYDRPGVLDAAIPGLRLLADVEGDERVEFAEGELPLHADSEVVGLAAVLLREAIDFLRVRAFDLLNVNVDCAIG